MRRIGWMILYLLLAAGVLIGVCLGVRVKPAERLAELPRRTVDLPAGEVGRIELIGHGGTVVYTGSEKVRQITEALCEVPLGEPEPYDGEPFSDGGDCMRLCIYRRDGTLYRRWSFRHDWRLRFEAPEGGGCYYDLFKPEVDMEYCHRVSGELALHPDFFR